MMKKLAMVGASNLFHPGGYGERIQKRLGNECDRFSTIGGDIGWILATILNGSIIGKYEYLLINYGSVNIHALSRGHKGRFADISALSYIFESCAGTATTPILLILPFAVNDKFDIYFTSALGTAKVFNAPIIDLHHKFAFTNTKSCTSDIFHFQGDFAESIAEEIIDCINIAHEPLIKINNGIIYESFIPAGLQPIENHGYPSIQKAQIPYFRLDAYDIVSIDPEKYLCGICYWHTTNMPFICYRNDYIEFRTRLIVSIFSGFDTANLIDPGFFEGLKGGSVRIWEGDAGIPEDPTHGALPPRGDIAAHVDLGGLILSNMPPIKYGEWFAGKYHNYFKESFNELNSALLEHEGVRVLRIWDKLEQLIPDAKALFGPVLETRPDIYELFEKDDEYRAEKLVLWAWQFGIEEVKRLASKRGDIAQAIAKMHNCPHVASYQPQNFTELAYTLWLIRPDLKRFDLATPGGQKALMSWFWLYGIHEYKLANIPGIGKKQPLPH